MDIVIATNNAHKVEEIRKIFEGFDVKCYSLKDLGIKSNPEETGKTFTENAVIKAKAVADQTKMTVIADDSGLTIPSLPDILGIYSSRFMGEDTPYDVKCKEVIRLLEGKDRKAYFTSAIAVLNFEKEPLVFVGEVHGTIAYEAKGAEGFGYDPIFIPDGYDKSMAELGNEVKKNISHRAVATRKLYEYMKDRL